VASKSQATHQAANHRARDQRNHYNVPGTDSGLSIKPLRRLIQRQLCSSPISIGKELANAKGRVLCRNPGKGVKKDRVKIVDNIRSLIALPVPRALSMAAPSLREDPMLTRHLAGSSPQ